MESEALEQTAQQYERMGILFYLATPTERTWNFKEMREGRYLLDLGDGWTHNTYAYGLFRLSPAPSPLPWLA